MGDGLFSTEGTREAKPSEVTDLSGAPRWLRAAADRYVRVRVPAEEAESGPPDEAVTIQEEPGAPRVFDFEAEEPDLEAEEPDLGAAAPEVDEDDGDNPPAPTEEPKRPTVFPRRSPTTETAEAMPGDAPSPVPEGDVSPQIRTLEDVQTENSAKLREGLLGINIYGEEAGKRESEVAFEPMVWKPTAGLAPEASELAGRGPAFAVRLRDLRNGAATQVDDGEPAFVVFCSHPDVGLIERDGLPTVRLAVGNHPADALSDEDWGEALFTILELSRSSGFHRLEIPLIDAVKAQPVARALSELGPDIVGGSLVFDLDEVSRRFQVG